MAEPEEIEDDNEAAADPADAGATPDPVDDTGDDEDTDDEAGDENAGDEGSSPEGAAPAVNGAGDAKPMSRAEKRIAALRQQARDAEIRATRAEAIAEERARLTAPAAQGLSEAEKRAREEKLALMDPQERKEFEHNEALQELRKGVLLTQLQAADGFDKASYTAKAASNPVYAKHADAVEARLAKERRNGVNYTRETILAQIIGEAALKAKPSKVAKAAAKERVESTAGKPVPGRSSVGGVRGRVDDSLAGLEKRLENVPI